MKSAYRRYHEKREQNVTKMKKYEEFSMLVRFKKNQEKIAMGLLSLMPFEKELKLLQQTMHEYMTNPDWHLYLWKENDDIVGAIGLKIVDDINVVIQHITVNPSFRNSGIGYKMVAGIQRLYSEKYDVVSNEMTEDFFIKCIDKQKEAQEAEEAEEAEED